MLTIGNGRGSMLAEHPCHLASQAGPPRAPSRTGHSKHAWPRRIPVADLPAYSNCSVGWFVGKRRLGIRCRNSQTMQAPQYVARKYVARKYVARKYVARKGRHPFFEAVRNQAR